MAAAGHVLATLYGRAGARATRSRHNGLMFPDSRVPSRDELIDHLVRTRIAGDVATPRDNNLAHYRELANGNPYYWFGVEFGDRWSDEQDVLAVMAELCGVSEDPEHRRGQDTIDPELTVAGLERAAAELGKAAADRARVLTATGHPGGLLDMHAQVAAALRAAGCELVRVPLGLTADQGVVTQLAGVAVYERGASLWHTHSPAPMAEILDALPQEGEEPPGLVFADHGWAGCAAQRGLTTVGFADSNDPALFLAESEGTLTVCVPLDDHVVNPRFYEPMTAYLLDVAGLA